MKEGLRYLSVMRHSRRPVLRCLAHACIFAAHQVFNWVWWTNIKSSAPAVCPIATAYQLDYQCRQPRLRIMIMLCTPCWHIYLRAKSPDATNRGLRWRSLGWIQRPYCNLKFSFLWTHPIGLAILSFSIVFWSHINTYIRKVLTTILLSIPFGRRPHRRRCRLVSAKNGWKRCGDPRDPQSKLER